MKKSLSCVVQSWLSLVGSAQQQQLCSLGMVMGLGIMGTALVPAQAEPLPQGGTLTAALEYPASGAVSRPIAALEDGTYLYGQANQPDQRDTEYFVFQVRSDRVIGAFYMPQSGFDCFAGTFAAGQLDVTVIPSDQQLEYDHIVTLNRFYPLSPQANDQNILNVCLQDNSHTALEP